MAASSDTAQLSEEIWKEGQDQGQAFHKIKGNELRGTWQFLLKAAGSEERQRTRVNEA